MELVASIPYMVRTFFKWSTFGNLLFLAVFGAFFTVGALAEGLWKGTEALCRCAARRKASRQAQKEKDEELALQLISTEMRVIPPVSGKDPFDCGALAADAYKSIPLQCKCDECRVPEVRRIRRQEI